MNEHESKFAFRKEMKKCRKNQKARLDVQGVEPQRGEILITASNVGRHSMSNALPVEQKQDRRR